MRSLECPRCKKSWQGIYEKALAFERGKGGASFQMSCRGVVKDVEDDSFHCLECGYVFDKNGNRAMTFSDGDEEWTHVARSSRKPKAH